MTDIQPGTTVIIAGDIVIGREVAFSRGDTVTVEQVSPNFDRPEYKYTILSPRFGRRFQLRDQDLLVPSSPPPTPIVPPYASQSVQPQQALSGAGSVYPNPATVMPQTYKTGIFSNRRKPLILISVIAVVVIVAVIGAVFLLKGNNYGIYKVNAEVVMKELEGLNSGLDVGYQKTDYTEAVRKLNTAFQAFEGQCSEAEKKYESNAAISAAVMQYVLAEDQWQSDLEDPYTYEVDDASLQEKWLSARGSVTTARSSLNSGK